MKHPTSAAISLLMVAVGLVGCAENQPPATADETPAVREANVQGSAPMCPMMAAGAGPMGQATAIRVTAVRPGQNDAPAAKASVRAINVQPGRGMCPMMTAGAGPMGQGGPPGATNFTMRPMASFGCPMASSGCPMAGGGMMAGATRWPFGPAGAQELHVHSQVATGKVAVARIESLAVRKDSPVDGIELLMRIAGSDAPAPVRRSAIFAASRLHERAGNLEQAAQILARVTLLPDDPRPRPPGQLPPDVREAAERLENRRRELDELAHELERGREELSRQQRELEEMARRLRQAAQEDD